MGYIENLAYCFSEELQRIDQGEKATSLISYKQIRKLKQEGLLEINYTTYRKGPQLRLTLKARELLSGL